MATPQQTCMPSVTDAMSHPVLNQDLQSKESLLSAVYLSKAGREGGGRGGNQGGAMQTLAQTE